MSRSASRRLLVTAVTATSVALLASACGKSSTQAAAGPVSSPTSASTQSSPQSSPSSSPTKPATPHYATGTALISDGTDVVTIGGTPVHFPTAVSEAAWSPDGSRIAFIDGSGNVATSRADGSSVVVLVKPDQGAKLSGPAWQGGTVLYTEQNSAGTHFVRQATAVGQSDHSYPDLAVLSQSRVTNLDNTSNPAGLENRNVDGTFTTLAFQTAEAKGPELWIYQEDSNSRGGFNGPRQLAAGSSPALSADGDVAFVGSGGGIEVVTADALNKLYLGAPTVTKVADGAAGANHLAWTADGKSVAYSTPTGIMEVAVGQPGAIPTQLSAQPGTVSFLPAATDKVVPLSGNSSTDLIGASVSVSRHRWLTQAGTTPEPAGGGAHGPYGMSVTIVAADDPAAAQKELGWAGMYGPTLLSTGHGPLDPRLTAEIKRVLGKPETNNPYPGTDTVYLVGAPDAFPAADDSAITSLGYKVARVSSAPKPGDSPSTSLPPIAVVDPADSAALNEAKADGARVMQLSGGQITAADLTYLKGLGTDWSVSVPQIVAFGDKAFSAASAVKLQRFATPVEALGDTHADYLAATAASFGTLVVTPADSPVDALLAALSAPWSGGRVRTNAVVTVDPSTGVSPTLKALLDTQSAAIGELDVIDTAGKLGSDLEAQLGALIGGPLGVQTVPNQTADDVAKAQGVAGKPAE